MVHRESHCSVLRSIRPAPMRSPDVIVVAASRPAAHLATAAGLASRLDCILVALCSRHARPDEFAVLAAEWPALRWLAVEVPAGYHHPLLHFMTSAIDDVKVGRLGDLSLKRNLGFLLAWLAGWRSVLFLDDDIELVDPRAVCRGTAALSRLAVVGMIVDDYPDNSVVCHANRLAGGHQDVFVSGSAMLVSPDQAFSFFPEVYNEDWFFFLDSLTRHSVASTGSARQQRYEPFATPERAAAEEFGDLLAEGLVSLLHKSVPLSAGMEAAYWRQFLLQRREFIERAACRLDALEPTEEGRAALRALRAAEERRAAITPASCVAYLRTWRRDHSAWVRRIDELDCPVTVDRAVRSLGLSHYSAAISEVPTILRKDTQVTTMTAPAQSLKNDVRKPVIDPTARIAPTAQIGAPYRRLQQGEWDRLDRPTTIGADCDLGHFCVVGEEACIGDSSILDSFTLVAGGASIGANVLVTHRATVGVRAEVGDGCVIGGWISERSRVGTDCRVFGDLIHRQLDPTKPWDAPESMEGSPVVEEGAFVGWGATVVGGITIGAGAYVCAGATVTRDVDAGCIVTGTNERHTPQTWKGALGKSEFFLHRSAKVESVPRA